MLAGFVKYSVTGCMIVYLHRHGVRPFWGIATGLTIGAVILAMAFWPSTAPPPSSPPPPGI